LDSTGSRPCRGGQSPRRWGFSVTIGCDDQQTRGAEFAGHKPQEQQRCRIGGVQVVQDDQQRLGCRRTPQQPGDRIEEPKPGRGRLGRALRAAAFAGFLRKPGHQLGDGRGIWCVAAYPIGRRHPERSKDLEPRPVGRRAATFPAAAPEDADIVCLCSGREVFGEHRLADAGFPGDEEQAPATTDGVFETGRQFGHLGVTTDEGERGLRS
jgi:hypothetical protein